MKTNQRKHMNANRHNLAGLAARLAAIVAILASISAFGVPGVAAWRATVNSDWGTAANWLDAQLPSDPATGIGTTYIDAFNPLPVVSTLGNTTPAALYITPNAGMSVVSGGQLSIAANLEYGNMAGGDCLPINITGGELNVGNYITMGYGDYPAGHVAQLNISGGTVTAGNIAIHTTGKAKLDISGNGKFIVNAGGNAEYYVANKFITANGNAAGWSVNVDTTSLAGKVVLTATNIVVPPQGDVTWTGSVSSDWSNPGNWANGFPTNALALNVIINAAANPCVISNAGNYTLHYLYLGINAGLSVVSGGQLTITGDLTTGVWGNSLPVNITGGQLNMGGYLNMGAAGYAGSVNISGGTVTAGNFGINTTSGAKLDISGNGTFITTNNPGLLGAIHSWVNNGFITANGNAPRWSVNVDTNSIASKLVLTAVYQPTLPPVDCVFSNAGGDNLWMNPTNWNPARVPGLYSEYDTATVAGGLSVVLNSGAASYVEKLTAGGTNGEGGVHIEPFCNVTFQNTNISVIVGGVTNGGVYPSRLWVNGGTMGTVGDLVLGGSGGRVDARHYDGYCAVGGTLRVGSYLYPPDASVTNVSLRLVGNSGAMTNIGAIEIGNAATVAYEFNGANSIKSLVATGMVNILPGAALTVDGTGLSGSTRDFTLFRGASRTGTFSTVNMTNFPAGAVPSLVYTATEVKLSVTLAAPDIHLAIQRLGDGQTQTSWNFGSLESATNIQGPWQLVSNAVSPSVGAASGTQKFSRVKVKELRIPRVTTNWANALRLVGAGNPLYSDFSLIKDKLGRWHCMGCFGHSPADPTNSGYVLSDGYTLFHAVGNSLTAPMALTNKIPYQIATAQAYMWAPGTVWNQDNTTAFMYYFHFYGSDSPIIDQSGCRLLTSSSPDLSTWLPYAGNDLPEQNLAFRDIVDRDFCVFWDARLGKYLIYYCSDALKVRTSSDLLHWSAPVTVLRSSQPDMQGHAESPQVIYRDGYYYLWTSGVDYSHATLFISEDPFNFGDVAANIIEETPGHAPEVVSEAGVDYMACSMVSTVPSRFPADYNLDGILIQPLHWDNPDPGMEARVTRKP